MAITTNRYPAELTRGDTFIQEITVRKTDGSTKDITGATAIYTVRANDYSGTLAIQKTTSSGIQITSPAVGVLHVTLLPADTATLIPRKKYVYDCEVTLTGEVQTVQEGPLTVKPDVSY